MIRVIGRAMIATSIRAATRFEKLPGVRKNGDSALPMTISPRRATSEERLPARERARPAAPAACRLGVAAVIGRRSACSRAGRCAG